MIPIPWRMWRSRWDRYCVPDTRLGTTSRACFNDFVILVQSATPETVTASQQGAKVMLTR